MIDKIPWIALTISIISIVISMYKIYRDRSKLVCWSEIIYHKSMRDNKLYPVMHLYAVNKGLRPITLTDIGYSVSRNNNVWTPIRPLSDTSLDIFDSEFESNIPQQLSHETGIRLEDGDIYEVRIRHNEESRFHSSYHDYQIAKKMFFKDVFGNKYYIKNSGKNIKILDLKIGL